MENSTLDLIPNSPNLHNAINESKIIEQIVLKIQKIPQYQKLQKDFDLILFICNAIESLVYENKLNKQKGFKKDIACAVFDRLGWSQPADKEFLINAIEHFVSTNRIKKVKLITKAKSYAFNFFLGMLIKK